MLVSMENHDDQPGSLALGLGGLLPATSCVLYVPSTTDPPAVWWYASHYPCVPRATLCIQGGTSLAS